MIRKLLLSHQKPFQLLLTWTGAFTGFFLLLAALQFYLDFKELLTVKNDWIHSEYLVINKKISLLNAIHQQKGFDEEEISDLKKLDGVSEIGEFTSNRFRAAGTISPGGDADKKMYADLFFEALPDHLLDVKSNNWKWQPGDETIPVIVPADYLKLYNFGFAPSQNLPQLSESTVAAAVFDILIETRSGTIRMKGQIAGYSNRINSILVPLSFMEYANKEYGTGEKTLPSRLVLVVKNPTDAQLLKFLETKNYETNSEQLRNARLSSVLQAIVSIIVVIGGVIIFLSILGFVQYSQLAMNRTSYEIRTLVDIGYSPARIFGFYARYSLYLVSAIALCSMGGMFWLKSVSDEWIKGYGFELGKGLQMATYWEALFIFALFLSFQLITIQTGIRRLSTPKK